MMERDLEKRRLSKVGALYGTSIRWLQLYWYTVLPFLQLLVKKPDLLEHVYNATVRDTGREQSNVDL